MRRALLLLSISLAALGPAAFAAAAKPPAPAHVALERCESSLDRNAREAVFEGRMRAFKGATKLQQRFTLEQLVAGSADRWAPVTATGYDAWKSADPGVRRYVLTKAIANLAAPASYRVTVRFRWADSAGRVLLRRKLVSAVCRQLDLRPDLRVTSVDVVPGVDPARTRYAIGVRNTGRTTSGSFEVVLNLDGADRPAGTVAGLAPGERALVELIGPRCTPGAALIATADAGTTVDEALESNNTFGRLCPFGAS